VKSLLSCSVVAEDTLPDNLSVLDSEVICSKACYTALPMAFIQAESIDVLKDVYEFDLLRYLSRSYPKSVDDVASFFKWMELKVRFEMIP
jgi:hypothetical protein